MKLGKRILVCAGCLLLLLAAWFAALHTPSASEKQLALIKEAEPLIEDKIYIRAEPLLAQAAEYNGEYTQQAESMLKDLFIQMSWQNGYLKKYTNLLDKQMSRKDAPAEVFQEAAQYYFGIGKQNRALEILRDGIERTDSQELRDFYEQNRYAYRINRTAYDDVTAIYEGAIAVQLNGLWGLARADGTSVITCQYEKISTFSAGRAIVQKDGEIFAVDQNNNRLALLKEGDASDIGNFSEGLIPILIGGEWHRASGELAVGSAGFEELGTYSGGYAAAKQNGKWGVVDTGSDWLLEAKYDRIITDELGRACGQGAVFVQEGDLVYLFVDGEQLEGVYEDAQPFSASGYAAVKQNGKWGFIDTSGTVQIQFQYDHALSFDQGLAAVELEGKWGYVSLSGDLVIAPAFYQAKSFYNGSAPVLTERGWQFITLLEYKA